MTAPVLLVHGFASSFERNWREPGWADLLAESGRQVIGIDLLGHGSADKPHDPAAYAHLDESVIAALPDDGVVDALPDIKLVTLRGADHFGTPKDFRFLDAALEFLDAVP